MYKSDPACRLCGQRQETATYTPYEDGNEAVRLRVQIKFYLYAANLNECKSRLATSKIVNPDSGN